MIVGLDPFQFISAVHFAAEPPAGITVTSAGRMGVAAGAVFAPSLCGGGGPGPGTFGNYAVTPTWYLSAALFECNQFDITIHGQTSGVTHYFGFYDELAAIPMDCPFPASCKMWLVVDEELGETNPGFWASGDERYQHSTRLWALTDLGFIDNEVVDVTIPDNVPSRPITSITQAGARPLVEVDQNIETEYFEDSWLTVSGTANYDGVHQVVSPFTNLFLLETAYIADEAGVGTTTPNYQKTVFIP